MVIDFRRDDSPRPCRMYDGEGFEINDKVVSCDTVTGDVEIVVLEKDGTPKVNFFSDAVATKHTKRPSPLRVVPLGN